MMLYPTVADLTNSKVNRYKLVIATAKCARHIIDEANFEKIAEEKYRLENDRFGKETKCEAFEILLTEKPVSVAVKKLHTGDYRIITD